ncbi:PaaX family transcriptional regulator [Pseudoduganella violacea]|uniref:Phenylacetic acid degradation operon negative regulatory protein n=1 Tax=Pseudoduganella violacea TaxID=1715466 RepID=A0A7W5BE55_9BURK|nr:PaaX family transcriptional regulator C-terminal domain-containing protein [Pseudoduganella violacea]MBB3121479.1 phenylacetic acid degradation operon negative regulatory protein [Pseudoduganella violacea]
MLNDWIERYMARSAPSSTALLRLAFGDQQLAQGQTIWLRDLIALMKPFRFSERLTRTSVSRLVQQGWLTPRRQGRHAAYAIASSIGEQAAAPWRCTAASPQWPWKGEWTLVINAPADDGALPAAQLRSALVRQGYGVLAPNVLARPVADCGTPAIDAGSPSLDSQVPVIRLNGTQMAELPPLRRLAQDAWNLATPRMNYERFLTQFDGLHELLAQGEKPNPETAFLIRMLAVHSYCKARLCDPLLPAEFLPESWPAMQAYQLLHELDGSTADTASQYWRSVVTAH